ncbi:MAG TPA: DUF3516 domain-containing protein [Thermoanaerobaculia bacterium]|nr:DUF3516 domain-containing protein [Thermoanaerobaculia bacterium]
MTSAPAVPEAASRPLLASYLPGPEGCPPDEALDRFLAWAAAAGFALYPAQEEALLELWAGRHVVLNTPTGSGKSLVALGLHFKGLCAGEVSYYTSPIKALASEKFFALCDELGAERVGMLTGDAAINPEAKVVCCTAEVLANMALRTGPGLDAPAVVMDEFHYYSDAERGWAWQVPLILLPRSRFLLMSATLGDMSRIVERLEQRTGTPVARVTSAERPVPLDYEWRETPLQQTIESLLAEGKAPIYVVNFTQRECAELAQGLTSIQIATREERERIREAMAEVRLDTPYGKEFRRFLSFGIGVHHAGLLPKYRLLVEQLAQQGLLRVIAGTDTLGVGVNIPIRTVLFTRLAKFDGRKIVLLSVRDFQQIAGRAGRKGFDTRGSVVAQAPEEVIARRIAQQKGKRLRPPARPAEKGEVSWTEETFQRLINRPPETLRSRFRITHGMVLNLLQRDAEENDPTRRNFTSLRELVALCHEDDASKRRLLSFAASLVRSLAHAGVLEMERDRTSPYYWVVVASDLQWDFSLFHALSLFLVETLSHLEPESEAYPLDLLSLVEAILENPEIVLRKQVDRLKGELVAELKAQGLSYEERMERLAEVTHPQPLADFLHGQFARFRRSHPWVGGNDVAPKSIGREMLESYWGFSDYVKQHGLQRSEGVLLRYLSQLYKTLDLNVPAWAKTAPVWDALSYFRTLVQVTDSSLLEEWESLLHPELARTRGRERERAVEALWIRELVESAPAFAARVRAEMHLLLRALSLGDWEEAATRVRQDPDDPWDADRLANALLPYLADYGSLPFTPAARRHDLTRIERLAERRWRIRQTLLDPREEGFWAIEAEVDLTSPHAVDGPLLRLTAITG